MGVGGVGDFTRRDFIPAISQSKSPRKKQKINQNTDDSSSNIAGFMISPPVVAVVVLFQCKTLVACHVFLRCLC